MRCSVNGLMRWSFPSRKLQERTHFLKKTESNGDPQAVSSTRRVFVPWFYSFDRCDPEEGVAHFGPVLQLCGKGSDPKVERVVLGEWDMEIEAILES